jgi:NADPH:quinone reductase-like Zn-dependent oxidoreductase
MLYRKALLQPQETVLIHAAGSGVSSAAIQIAKLLGGFVVTTVSTAEKEAKAKSLGADIVLNSKSRPLKDQLKELRQSLGGRYQDRRGFDVILDHVGKSTFSESLRALTWGGRLVTCGATTGSEIEIDLKPIFFKSLSILGATMGAQSDLKDVLEFVRTKKINPIVDSIYPFLDYPKALAHIEQRRAFGKVLIGLSGGAQT